MGCAAVGVAELEEGFVECSRARLRVGGGMCSCADMAGGGGGAAGRADIVAGRDFTPSVWRIAPVEAAPG